MNNEQRYKIVSDGNEYTVWDKEKQIDLFPTKGGNRDYACTGCNKETAKLITRALNYMELLKCCDEEV